MGTRLTIDSLTCLLANEHEPSRLLASSPGKLMRYIVEDGGHVSNDQPYAEVEVCPSDRLSVFFLGGRRWRHACQPCPKACRPACPVVCLSGAHCPRS
jgi:hypothetical protein